MTEIKLTHDGVSTLTAKLILSKTAFFVQSAQIAHFAAVPYVVERVLGDISHWHFLAPNTATGQRIAIGSQCHSMPRLMATEMGIDHSLIWSNIRIVPQAEVHKRNATYELIGP